MLSLLLSLLVLYITIDIIILCYRFDSQLPGKSLVLALATSSFFFTLEVNWCYEIRNPMKSLMIIV